MTRTILEQRFAQAEARVALGERHIARQRELVAELGGEDAPAAVEARRLLANFEALQEVHRADRDRLQRKLAQQS